MTASSPAVGQAHAALDRIEKARDDSDELIGASFMDHRRLVSAVRAALNLHRSNGHPTDPSCDAYAEHNRCVPWPCETVRTLTAALTEAETNR